MREVFIKYNPYKVETIVKIDGNEVKQNSNLYVGEKRLQEWIEELPKILIEECNSKDFKIIFHGTILDYEDLVNSINSYDDKDIKFECEHIKAKEIEDKEEQIVQIFREIQDGPFDELKSEDVKKSFELALKEEFEVNVIATMSAGKSTLINALLGEKLMPSKNESCTATITKIKDTDKKDKFTAVVKNNENNLLESFDKLTYEDMQRLNSESQVSVIEVEGDIPFVKADETALVLVDTPGPNNSRDASHRESTQRALSESSKTLVLYILNATQLAVNDDNQLLNEVAKSMEVGGKQSKDRFIFVVNKLDQFRKGEDDVEETLKKVREYLESKGINNPNIFPTSALTALDIRTIEKNGEDFDYDLADEVELNVKKFNRDEKKHFEKYSDLTPSIKALLNKDLENARGTKNKFEEALIHTGIRPVEEYINMYVEKYARTAKIKNIVDTFEKRLEATNKFENLKKNISENEDKNKEIIKKIQVLKLKIGDAKDAKKFKEKIDSIDLGKKIINELEELTKESQRKVTEIQEKAESRINKATAEMKVKEYETFINQLEAKMKVKIDSIIDLNLKRTVDQLIDDYTNRLNTLSGEIKVSGVEISAFDLVVGDVKYLGNLIEDASRTETEEEEIWIENTNKKWYKPWTWLQEKGHWKTIYTDVEYVDGKVLAKSVFSNLQVSMYENNASAISHTKKQVKIIKEHFKHEIDKIDNVLKCKLAELEECASDSEVAKIKLKESKERLKWLEEIQNRVKNILEV